MVSCNYKNDFKILDQNLVYLDSAATSLKPQYVIDRIEKLLPSYISTLSKGYGYLVELTENLVDQTRKKVASFIGATKNSIVFTPNTTSSINYLAYGYIDQILSTDGSIIITNEEHHSNVLPWMKIISKLQTRSLKIADISQGDYLSRVCSLIDKNVKLISVSLIGNIYGRVNLEDIKAIIKEAHSQDILVLVDAAQAPLSVKIDVKDLNPDFLTLSSHKMYATGNTGILYIKEDLIDKIVPTIIGGGTLSDLKINTNNLKDSVLKVDKDLITKLSLTFNNYQKFESGTQPVLDIISILYALDYIESIGVSKISKINKDNLIYLYDRLKELGFVDIITPNTLESIESKKDSRSTLSSILSFNIPGIHPHDIGFLLGEKNICLRSGMQCASLLLNTLKIPSGCLRASLGIHNSTEDIDSLIEEINNIYTMFLKK